MQFTDRPRDDEPWPHDMLITVDDYPSTLMAMLFVRSAWELDDNGVPALESVPSSGSTQPPRGVSRAELNARWAGDWQRALEVVAPGAARVGRPDVATQLLIDADLSVDEFLEGASPETFWRRGLDADALWAWQLSLRRIPTEGSMGPEHDVVDWLVPVWRSGLRSIVVLPFAGYYVNRMDSQHMMVSHVTRNDPQLYSLALSTM